MKKNFVKPHRVNENSMQAHLPSVSHTPHPPSCSRSRSRSCSSCLSPPCSPWPFSPFSPFSQLDDVGFFPNTSTARRRWRHRAAVLGSSSPCIWGWRREPAPAALHVCVSCSDRHTHPSALLHCVYAAEPAALHRP